MKAKYFRMMYQNAENGMVHTFSTADTETGDKYTLCYLNSLKGNTDPIAAIDERFENYTETIDLMVLAVSEEPVIGQALKIAAANSVHTVLLPGDGAAAQDAKKRLLRAGVKEVLAVENENVYECVKPWQIKVIGLGTGAAASLVLYHDAIANQGDERDCVLTVKPLDQELSWTACVDPADLSCDMQAALYNDFDICKRHNQRDGKGYVTGTLLLGRVNLKEYSAKLKVLLSEERKNIRFTALPEGGRDEYYSAEFLDWLDQENADKRKYFIAPSKAAGNEAALKDILLRGGRHTPILTGNGWGLCASGYFVKRPVNAIL